MDAQKLIEILLELRSASMEANANPTEEHVKSIMRKYDMLMLGGNFNTIYSVELAHSINTVFNEPVELEEINGLLPQVCKALNMKYEPMIEVSKIADPNRPIHSYQITLW